MQQWYQCPNCRAPVAFGVRFCGNCGMQLNWPTQQQMQPPRQYQQQIQQSVHMNWFKRHLNWTYFLGLLATCVVLLASIPFSEAVAGIVWFVCVCCLRVWVIARKGRNWAWNLMPILWLWIPLLLGNAKGK